MSWKAVLLAELSAREHPFSCTLAEPVSSAEAVAVACRARTQASPEVPVVATARALMIPPPGMNSLANSIGAGLPTSTSTAPDWPAERPEVGGVALTRLRRRNRAPPLS